MVKPSLEKRIRRQRGRTRSQTEGLSGLQKLAGSGRRNRPDPVGIESHPPNELARLKRELGKRIRSLREEKGLTRAQLAQACSLRYAYLSNIETGNHDVRLLALISIARSLEVTAELLFNGIL